jgi:hypothetical protein
MYMNIYTYSFNTYNIHIGHGYLASIPYSPHIQLYLSKAEHFEVEEEEDD